MSSVNNLLERIRLTPVVNTSGKDNFEIHTLTSHRHVFYYLWSIKSFLWKSELNPKIIVHGDGTLTNKDLAILKSQIGGIKILTKKGADKQILPSLKGYPACYKYRSEQPFAKKVFDVFLSADSQKIMILDSDILFFRQPTEIINWADNEDNRMLFNWAPLDTEEAMHQKLKRDMGLEYATGYNSGLQCITKDIFDIEFLENYLSYCYEQKNLDWWVIEQRSMALLTYKYNPDLCKPLLRTRYFFQNRRNVFYENRGINAFPTNLVAKHYSRYSRNLFAKEGIKKLLKNNKLL